MFERFRRVLPEGERGGTVRIAIALILVVSASALFWASRDYGVRRAGMGRAGARHRL